MEPWQKGAPAVKKMTKGAQASYFKRFPDREDWFRKNHPDMAHFDTSVKQASKAKAVDKAALEKKSLQAYGAGGTPTGGEGGNADAPPRDTIVPLSRETRSKIQKAKRDAEAAAKPPKAEKPAAAKPLTKAERIAAIARAAKKAQSPAKHDVATQDPDDRDHDDYVKDHYGMHQYTEEVEQIDEISVDLLRRAREKSYSKMDAAIVANRRKDVKKYSKQAWNFTQGIIKRKKRNPERYPDMTMPSLTEMAEEVEQIDERKSSDPKGIAYKITAASHAANPSYGPHDPSVDPKTNFGAGATRSSALAGLRAARQIKKSGGNPNDPEHIETISKAVHGSPSDYGGTARGWSQHALTSPNQTPEQKARRAKLTGGYGGLSDEEKEKDRQIARVIANRVHPVREKVEISFPDDGKFPGDKGYKPPKTKPKPRGTGPYAGGRSANPDEWRDYDIMRGHRVDRAAERFGPGKRYILQPHKPTPKNEEVELEEGKMKSAAADRDDKGHEDFEATLSHAVKMAKGVAFDKRYKGGNMTGAVRAIRAIGKKFGMHELEDHPEVSSALRRANEELEINEMDSEGYKGHRDDEDSGKGPEKHAKRVTTKQAAKDALKILTSKVRSSRESKNEEVEYIEERLSKSDPASTWISHFVSSENPMFSGKTKKERINMALGAYYKAKRAAPKNEEVEIDESKHEGRTPESEEETELAKHHGNPNKITYGDVVKARIASAKKKKTDE